MCTPGYRDQSPPTWDRTGHVNTHEAEEFLRMLHSEHPSLGPVERRLEQVRREIAESGTYVHTTTELTFGARIAWRNSSRCIGRLYWRSLLIRDLRAVDTAEAIHQELVRHLEIAVGDHGERGAGDTRDRPDEPGIRHIRPVISVFAPAMPGRPYSRVWNDQLIRYAAYQEPDGTVIGDPRYVEFTESVTGMGWKGKRDRFDVLPLVIEAAGDRPRLFDLPEHAVVEVPLHHPEFPWFAELGLRWHAVPAISNMRLTIGGIDYPLAPFNGWYMGTEIGARNLADDDRYNQLPVVAARMGLDMSSESTLWRDRALVELNRAVLWSFEREGLRISNHHTESRRFLDHVAKEERNGRQTPADWTWIVPPMSGAATPVFHRYFHEADQKPNFYLDPVARDLGRYGRVTTPAEASPAAAETCPFTGQSTPRPATAHTPTPDTPIASVPPCPRRTARPVPPARPATPPPGDGGPSGSGRRHPPRYTSPPASGPVRANRAARK
jgi:nitric-oxide synthase